MGHFSTGVNFRSDRGSELADTATVTVEVGRDMRVRI